MPPDVIARDAAQICQRVNLKKLEGKTILITGASGLLGTYFLATLAHLKQNGVPVNVIAQVRSEPARHTAEIIQRGGFQLAQVNVADHAECSSLPLADVIIHSAGYEGELVFDASKPDGAPRKLLDTARLAGLGWEPKTSLDDGVAQAYAWYLQSPHVARSQRK